MLTLERARKGLVSLPLLTRIGLVILVLGGLADVVAHLEAAGHADHLDDHSASELSAHLIGFVGMVVILLGVVLDGVRRTHRGRPRADSTAPTRAHSTVSHESGAASALGGTSGGWTHDANSQTSPRAGSAPTRSVRDLRPRARLHVADRSGPIG